jgi:hypothetical protein
MSAYLSGRCQGTRRQTPKNASQLVELIFSACKEHMQEGEDLKMIFSMYFHAVNESMFERMRSRFCWHCGVSATEHEDWETEYWDFKDDMKLEFEQVPFLKSLLIAYGTIPGEGLHAELQGWRPVGLTFISERERKQETTVSDWGLYVWFNVHPGDATLGPPGSSQTPIRGRTLWAIPPGQEAFTCLPNTTRTRRLNRG